MKKRSGLLRREIFAIGLAFGALGPVPVAGAETGGGQRDSRFLAGSGRRRREFWSSGQSRPEALRRSQPLYGGWSQSGGGAGRGAATLRQMPDRALTLAHAQTGERLTASYCLNGDYEGAALSQLSYFLRDWRQDAVLPIDPQVLDVMALIQDAAGGGRPLVILSGYRTPATNEMLARSNPDVARNSYHLRGMAIDLTIPGVSTAGLGGLARSLGLGGVGYYPAQGFIHVDSGPVRYWQS